MLTDEAELLAGQQEWWVGGEPRAVEESKPHSGTLLAKLGGLGNREQAEALKGKPVSVPRERMPDPGEGRYYWGDLVGLEVVNAQGMVLGVVKGLFSNGTQDVMELLGEKPRLIPFVPGAVVKRVDLPERRIEIDWGADW